MLIHMSHNRGLVFRGTHYTKSPLITPTALTLIIHATKQQKKKEEEERNTVCLVWLDPHFQYTYNNLLHDR